MEFVPVPRVEALFCKWPTRLQDFEAFVKDSGYNAEGGMGALMSDWWKDRGGSWRNHTYAQGPTHPVAGLSWYDANAFCDWLTKKERALGLLQPGQRYRLPTNPEWDYAVGINQEPDSKPTVYPWGDEWPPPEGTVNCAGEEIVRDGNWPAIWYTNVIAGHDDGYARTSPVGTFRPNRYGLHDMSGNVWEWSGDTRPGDENMGILRGGCWDDYDGWALESVYRHHSYLHTRSDSLGFRCVLDLSAEP